MDIQKSKLQKLLLFVMVFLLTLALILLLPEVTGRSPGLLAQMMGRRGIGTESDNPQVAALLQTHLSSMYQPLDRRQPFPMIRMIPNLPTLFNQAGNYQRQLQRTDQGVTVREATSDTKLAAVIRENALEVDQFVQEGITAMMDGQITR